MQTTVKWTLSIIVLIVFLGCGGEEKPTSPATTTTDTTTTGTTTGNIPAALYGKWVYVDDATEVELDSTTTLDYNVSSPNILKVGSRFLLRASVANTHVEGTVLGDTTTGTISANIIGPRLSSLSGIGGINVILRNTQDPNIKAEVTTDANGNFNDDTLPSGLYTVEGNATDGTTFSAAARLEGNETNLGNFQLADASGYNFKTELILDQDYVYADEQNYTGIIRIHNTGSADGVDIWADFNITDYYLKSFDYPIVNKYIKPGEYSDINITFSFNPLTTAKRTISVDVKVGDARSNTWNDRFTFDIYRRAMQINMASDTSAIRGFVVYEGNKIVPFNTSNGSLKIPVDPASNIYMLVSNVTGEATKYSVGIDTSTIDYSSVRSSDHEGTTGNDTENTATTLALGNALASYAGTGDLDYFSIDQSSELITIGNTLTQTISNLEVGTTYQSTAISLNEILSPKETIHVQTDNGVLVINGVVTALTTATLDFNDTVAVSVDSLSTYNQEKNVSLSIGDINQTIVLHTRKAIASASPSSIVMLANDTKSVTLTSEANDTTFNYNPVLNSMTLTDGNLSFTPTLDEIGTYTQTITSQALGYEQNDVNVSIEVKRSWIDTNTTATHGTITMQLATELNASSVHGVTFFDNNWSQTENLKYSLYLTPSLTYYNNTLYVIGGNYGDTGQNLIQIYHDVNNSFTDVNLSVYSRYGQTSVLYGNKLLLIGGYGFVGNDAYNYQNNLLIDMDTFATKVLTVFTPSLYHQSVVQGSKVYTMGGEGSAPANPQYYNRLYVYDFDTNETRSLAPMHYARVRFSANILNNKIYVFGGAYSQSTSEVYDIATNTWEDLPYVGYLSDHTSHVINNKIYIFSSIGLLEFDPADNSTKQIGSAAFTLRHTSQKIGDLVYVFGGSTSSVVQVFDSRTLQVTRMKDLTFDKDFARSVDANGTLFISGANSTKLDKVTLYDSNVYQGTKEKNGVFSVNFTDLNSSVKQIGYKVDSNNILETYTIEVQ